MEILKKVMEKVIESRGIWRAPKSTNHVIKPAFCIHCKVRVWWYIYVTCYNLCFIYFCFLFQTVKSLSSNIEALKKEVELAAMAAKSKESPSQARQIVSANCVMINELLLVMKST